ncbi:hypothetical protein [Ectothiorhodospira marina]|uniref:Formylmethanofuran dehydrogenase subunit E domain-containing protein n=1 Tax=Ectothiorhodospira marina TaxID=1396821 RepID=A0A1H7QFP0_9GAMM|nr:hypothetical protein [Ectothiorhodospira marina]SEL46578.1 hypothetical protein SAMN05444515_11742 [Ectothiorhodospira marina]
MHSSPRRFVLASALGVILLAGLPLKQAVSDDLPQVVKDHPPIHVIHPDGVARSISLAQVLDHHGYPCGPATVGFLALQYGLDLLFGEDEIARANDLLVLSHAPMGGVTDALDLVLVSEKPESRTPRPAGMEHAVESFRIQLLRKSTMQTVTVALDPQLWPEDWFELRTLRRAGEMTPELEARRQSLQDEMVETLPTKSFETLFGTPDINMVMTWGGITSEEARSAAQQ